MAYDEFLDHDKHSGVKNYRFTIFGDKLLYTVPDIKDDEDEDGEERFYKPHAFTTLAKPLPLSQPTDVPVIPYVWRWLGYRWEGALAEA